MTGKTRDDDFVTTLVDLALARPSEERARYLQAECGEDTDLFNRVWHCLLYTSPSPRDRQKSRMPSSA